MFLKLDANGQKLTNKTLNNLENKITRVHCHKLDRVNKHTHKKKKQRREEHTMFLNLGTKKMNSRTHSQEPIPT
jgi:hypothetical protein